MIYNIAALDRRRPFMDSILAIIPDAIIAGGYIRDVLMDKPVRDMDVLIGREPTEDELLALAGIVGNISEYDPADFDSEYTEDPLRKSHIEKLWKGDEFDLIQVTNVSNHFEEFPDNISKAYYDGKLRMDNEFLAGHEHKVIAYNDGAGPARLLKLIDKYPDYEVHHYTVES